VAPYADAAGLPLELEDGLSEEDASHLSVARVVDALVAAGAGAVLCTHRPVLPKVFDALGLKNPRLELGEMLILHLRRGTAVASERQLGH
jgi:hypothetical protein